MGFGSKRGIARAPKLKPSKHQPQITNSPPRDQKNRARGEREPLGAVGPFVAQLTLIFRGLTSSRLLSVMVSTPSLSLALTVCSSTLSGSVKLRWKRL
jgi:hypothetical protein